MLKVQENERLTRVGPGTPMGELMRRYWQPIAAVAELDDNPVKQVKLLGESLVLYRDRQGRLGLIGDTCPHRRTSMLYGVPEDEGLRCPYHGWMFNETGQCIEMPAEAPDSTFPSRVKMAGYPVQDMCGLIFAYLGPEPVPLLPRWDMFVWDNVLRDIGSTIIPCNWLQIMENSLDPGTCGVAARPLFRLRAGTARASGVEAQILSSGRNRCDEPLGTRENRFRRV